MKFSKPLTREFAQSVIKYGLVQENDRILLGFSGGKDSFALAFLLKRMQRVGFKNFSFKALSVVYDDEDLSPQHEILRTHGIESEILKTNIFARSSLELRKNSSACSYFSRQRRGELYLYAKRHNFNKLALAHHLDDAVQSFFMNLFLNGKMRSMPPKYFTQDGALEVIRPLVQIKEEK
ncbi:MAG: tRNA 2-thiocytidine(32) synthetase TtcA, partial [Deltaproteobacteria bacterium]